MKKKTAPKLFDGASGRADLIRLLQEQKTVQGNVALAEKLANFVVPQNVKDAQILIHEGERDSDLYFILDGAMEFSIKGKKQGQRGGGNTVGEMAAIQSAQPRSAIGVHEDEQVVSGHLVPAHLLRCACGVAGQRFAYLQPGRNRLSKAPGDGDSLSRRFHQFQRHAGDLDQFVKDFIHANQQVNGLGLERCRNERHHTPTVLLSDPRNAHVRLGGPSDPALPSPVHAKSKTNCPTA